MFLRDSILRINNMHGQLIEIVDPQAVKLNFESVQNATVSASNDMRALEERLSRLERFMTFCRDNWPKAIEDFAIVEKAKLRIGMDDVV